MPSSDQPWIAADYGSSSRPSQSVTSGARGRVVLGEPAYYQRFGFVPAAELIYSGAPREYFQALALGYDVPVGAVPYLAAFNIKPRGST